MLTIGAIAQSSFRFEQPSAPEIQQSANVAQSWSQLTECGEVTVVECWPKSLDVGEMLAEIGPHSYDIGQRLVEFGQAWSSFARVGPSSPVLEPRSVGVRQP